MSKDSWHAISTKFNPKIFAIEEYGRIAELITKTSAEGKEPTSTRIYIEARKQGIDTKEILTLDQPVVKSEVPGLCDLLVDLYRKRLVLTKLKEAVHVIENGDQDTDEIVAVAQDALLQAFADDRKEVMDLQDVLEEVYETQMKAQQGQLDDAIPLGFEALDGLIKLVRGHQIVIAARPSMGENSPCISAMVCEHFVNACA